MFTKIKSHPYYFNNVILIWVLGCMLVITCSQLAADEITKNQNVKHGVGFSAGYILGTGLTYVNYLGPHMLQVSFIGNVDQYKTDYKIGLSYARYIHQVRQPRSMFPVALKFITGMDIHYQDGIVDSDVIVYGTQISHEGNNNYFFHTGAGLGIDIGNPGRQGLVFSLNLVYAISVEEVQKNWEWEVSPLPAMGILYNW